MVMSLSKKVHLRPCCKVQDELVSGPNKQQTVFSSNWQKLRHEESRVGAGGI